MCLVIRALEPDSSSVTPGSLTSTSATTGVSPSIAGTSRWAARSAIVTSILRPLTLPSAYVVAGSAADRPPGLAERGREQQLAAHDAGQQRLLLLVGAGPGDDQRATAEGLPDRQVPGAGAGLAQQHAHLGQPEALAAVRLRDGEPEQPGLGELGPAAVAVEHVGEHRPDRRERLCILLGLLLGARGVHLREAVGRHVQNCNVF